MLKLMVGSQEWVHRRVDTYKLRSDSSTRRFVSLDITIPKRLSIKGSKGKMYVPLALIEKSKLRDVDTADRDGKSLPILGRSENSQLSKELLFAAVPSWIYHNYRLFRQCAEHIHRLISADTSTSTELLDFDQWIESIESAFGYTNDTDLDLFATLARQLAKHFILVVEVDAGIVDTRTILKFSHDLNSPPVSGGAAIASFRIPLPDFGFSASQHVEVQVPAGLAVESMSMVEIDPSGAPVDADFDFPKEERTIGHVTLSPGSRFSAVEIRIDVVPSRRGISPFTTVVVPIVFVMMALAWIDKLDVLQITSSEFKVPSQSVSLFLIGPAILLSWLARNPEHNLVGTLLSPLRHMLLLSSASLVLMAAACAVPLTPWAWEFLWFTVASAQIIAFIWLLTFHLNVVPGRALRLLLKIVRPRSYAGA